MAITKLISPSTPNPLPPAGAGGDWDKAMAQLTAVKKLLSGEQMILTQWTNNTTAPALARGSYLQHLGAIYVVDTEDYALPAMSADGTHYIKLTISGETLVPSYITSLTGFSWSAQHNGLYNASDEQVLPYSVIREGSAYGKRKILNLASSPNLLARVDYQGNLYGNAISGASLGVTGNATVGGTLGVTGAISGATVNTGQGANELYAMNQNVRTTDSPTFATVNATDVVTTNGPNKPVDNTGSVMPNIGIGGFTYGYVNSGNITLPPFGTMMILYYAGNNFSASNSGRKSGGAILGFTGAGMIFAWRIA